MTCPTCQNENLPGAKFCRFCGAKFEPPAVAPPPACKVCGSALTAEDVFCPECGAKLEPAPVPPPAPAPAEKPLKPAAKLKKKPASKKILAIVLAAVLAAGGVAGAIAVYFGWVGFPIDVHRCEEENIYIYFQNPRGFLEIRGDLLVMVPSGSTRTLLPNPDSSDWAPPYRYSDYFKAGEYIPSGEYLDDAWYEFKLGRKPEKGGQYDGCYRLELWRNSYRSTFTGTTPQNMSYYAVVYIGEIDGRTNIMYRDGLPEMYSTHY